MFEASGFWLFSPYYTFLVRLYGQCLLRQDSVEMERDRRAALSPSQFTARSPLAREEVARYSQDGVPIVERRYRGFQPDSTGFRVYNAWLQHRQ